MSELDEALSRCRKGLGAVFVFSIAVNLLMLTVALYMLQVYDRVLVSQSVETLIFLTLLAFAALALLGLFDFLRSRVLVGLAAWVDRVLAPSVFQRGMANALSGAAYRTESLRDLATIRGFLSGPGVSALFDGPWVPVYLAAIYLLHPTLGHLALAGACLLVLLALVNHRLTRKHLGQASAGHIEALRSAETAFRNAEVVEGMGMGSALRRRWDADNANVLAAQAIASDRAGTISAITKAFRLMLQIAVLGVGAWLVLGMQMTPGGMIAASIILGRALAPLEQTIAVWRQVVTAREAWQRLAGLLAEPCPNPPAMALPRPAGRLELDGVSYAPPGARLPVIRGMSLAVAPGETLAVIGPSAAGKSTLARLIVGIGRPQVGRVRLDGADVSALCRDTIGRDIGYLPQDVELFPGTIRENIARMETGDPEKIVAAARMADVHEMILRLPDGYETVLDDRNMVLSGGQRQRIGLARALYGAPALLVLDEPNANLDGAGEEALNSAIAQAKRMGTTIVLIAHRPSMMAHADKVAVVKDGQLELFGEQAAVLARLQRERARPAVPDRPVSVAGQRA